MTAQARRIDETRLRRALSRVLAPALAAKVVDEATIADDEPVPTERQPTPRGMLAARKVYDLDRIGFEERRLPGYGGPTGPIIEGARGLDAPGGTEL